MFEAKFIDGMEIPKVDLQCGQKEKYPLAKMKVGQAYNWPDKNQKRNSIGSAVNGYAKRHGMKFTIRSVDGNVIVWRIE